MQFGLWARRQRGRTAKWEYYGYGPDLPPLPAPERISDAEYAAARRRGMWFAGIEIAIVVGTAAAVGLITRSAVAVFLAAVIVPCLILGVSFVVGAALGMRRLRATSLPAEPAGRSEPADDGPAG